MSTALNDVYLSMRSFTHRSFDLRVSAHAVLAPSKNFTWICFYIISYIVFYHHFFLHIDSYARRLMILDIMRKMGFLWAYKCVANHVNENHGYLLVPALFSKPEQNEHFFVIDRDFSELIYKLNSFLICTPFFRKERIGTILPNNIINPPTTTD